MLYKYLRKHVSPSSKDVFQLRVDVGDYRASVKHYNKLWKEPKTSQVLKQNNLFYLGHFQRMKKTNSRCVK